MLDRPDDELLDVATSTVDLAVRALREAPAPGVLSAKGDRDYASEVDLTIERLVREHLSAATPEIAFPGRGRRRHRRRPRAPALGARSGGRHG